MENFTYVNPTKIVFGKGCTKEIGHLLMDIKTKRVMLLYSGTFLEENKTLDQLENEIHMFGIKTYRQGGILPNPLISSIHEIASIASKYEIDCFLAIGGGSVIDTAKALAVCTANKEVSLEALMMGQQEISTCKNVGVVLTMAGSGSESSCSMVLTIDEGQQKRAFDHDLIRPNFAILDPTLTYSLPSYQMICGGCDILMHAMERYFSPSEHTELIDEMSEGLMRVVISSLQRSIKQPNNYEARANLMWAGSLSHNGLLGTGRVEDWATHRLEHELSGMFDVTHGAGLCALWGSWARYVYKKHLPRFVAFSRQVIGVDECDDLLCAKKGIEKLESLFQKMGMPISLADIPLHLNDCDYQQMSQNAISTDETIGHLEMLNEEDIMAIYRNAGGQS